MPELLAELVARISADATELKKGLADAEKDVEGLGKTTDKETRDISQSFKTLGKSFAIVGASITAAMGLVIKSFTATGSELHDLSLKTGVSVKSLAGLKYAAEQNGASLGTVEMALKRTAMVMSDVKDGTGEATKTFGKLRLSLKDLQGLNPEQQFLKIAGAIAEVPDPMQRAALAVDMFGRSGTDMLPMLSEGAAGLKKMVDEGVEYSGWTQEAANLADEFGDALGTLKQAVSGIFVAIGSNLVPTLKDFVSTATEVISKVSEWAKAHPELTKWLGLSALGVGTIITAVGLLILALPTLIASYKALIIVINAAKVAQIGFNLALWGPVGALAGLAALLLYLNLSAAKWEGYGKAVSDTTTEQKGFTNELEAGKKALEDLASKTGIAAGTLHTYDEINNSLKRLRDAYGDLGNAIKSKGDLARDSAAKVSQGLDRELDAARNSYNYQMGFLSDLYSEKIRLLNAGSNDAIKAIQDQIDNIDRQTEAEERALRDREDAERAQTLTGKDLIDFLAEVERRHLRERRQDEKDALRDSIENIRTDTQSKVDALEVELKEAQDTETLKLVATENRIAQAKIALDTALTEELARLAQELKEKEDIEIAKLGATQNRLAAEETANRESHTRQLEEAAIYQANLEAILKDIVQTVTTVHVSVGGGGGAAGGEAGVMEKAYESTVASKGKEQADRMFGLARGGIVTQPTIAMIGEAGPEAVIPLNETGRMGGITINFTQPVFFDREDQMNRFADIIRKAIQRQDRLRFGGAFNG